MSRPSRRRLGLPMRRAIPQPWTRLSNRRSTPRTSRRRRRRRSHRRLPPRGPRRSPRTPPRSTPRSNRRSTPHTSRRRRRRRGRPMRRAIPRRSTRRSNPPICQHTSPRPGRARGRRPNRRQNQQRRRPTLHLLIPLSNPRSHLCGNQPVSRPTWLGRAARNRQRHAIEQASRRWRGERAVNSDFHTGRRTSRSRTARSRS